MLKKWKLLLATSALVVGGAAGFAGAKTLPPAHRAKLLEKFDANRDGKLDAGERVAMKEARAERVFAKLDANSDGKLTLEEFKAGRMAMRGHHKRLHGGAKRP